MADNNLQYMVEDKSGKRFSVPAKGFDPFKYAYVRMVNDKGEDLYIESDFIGDAAQDGFRRYTVTPPQPKKSQSTADKAKKVAQSQSPSSDLGKSAQAAAPVNAQDTTVAQPSAAPVGQADANPAPSPSTNPAPSAKGAVTQPYSDLGRAAAAATAAVAMAASKPKANYGVLDQTLERAERMREENKLPWSPTAIQNNMYRSTDLEHARMMENAPQMSSSSRSWNRGVVSDLGERKTLDTGKNPTEVSAKVVGRDEKGNIGLVSRHKQAVQDQQAVRKATDTDLNSVIDAFENDVTKSVVDAFNAEKAEKNHKLGVLNENLLSVSAASEGFRNKSELNERLYNATSSETLFGYYEKDADGKEKKDKNGNKIWHEGTLTKEGGFMDNIINSTVFDVDADGQPVGVKPHIEREAGRRGMSLNGYISKVLYPQVQNKVMERLFENEVSRQMPKGELDRFKAAFRQGFIGQVGAILTQNVKQRQASYEAVRRYDEKNQPGIGKRIAYSFSTTLSDAPLLLAGGAVGSMVSKGSASALRGVASATGRMAARTAAGTATNRIMTAMSSFAPKVADVISPAVSQFASEKAAMSWSSKLLANLSRPKWWAANAVRGLVNGAPNMQTFMGIKGVTEHVYSGGDTSGSELWNAYLTGSAEGLKMGTAMAFTGPLAGMIFKNPNTLLKSFGVAAMGKGIEVGTFVGMEYYDAYKQGTLDDVVFSEKVADNIALVAGMALATHPAHAVGSLMSGARRTMWYKTTMSDGKGHVVEGWKWNPIKAWQQLTDPQSSDVLSKEALTHIRSVLGNDATVMDMFEFSKKVYGRNSKSDRANAIFAEALESGDAEAWKVAEQYADNLFRLISDKKNVPWNIRNEISIKLFGIADASKPLFSHAELDPVTKSARLVSDDGELIAIKDNLTTDEYDRLVEEQTLESDYHRLKDLAFQILMKEDKGVSIQEAIVRSGMGEEMASILTKPFSRLSDSERSHLRDILNGVRDEVEKDADRERAEVKTPEETEERALADDSTEGKETALTAAEAEGKADADRADLAGENPDASVVDKLDAKWRAASDNWNRLFMELARAADSNDALARKNIMPGRVSLIEALSFLSDRLANGYIDEDTYNSLKELVISAHSAKNMLDEIIHRRNAFLDKTEENINTDASNTYNHLSHADGNVYEVAVDGDESGRRLYLADGLVEGGVVKSMTGFVILRDEMCNTEIVNVESAKIVSATDRDTFIRNAKDTLEETTSRMFGLDRLMEESAPETAPVAEVKPEGEVEGKAEEAPVTEQPTEPVEPQQPVSEQPVEPTEPIIPDGKPETPAVAAPKQVAADLKAELGDVAESAVDGEIAKAQKALDDANAMPVDDVDSARTKKTAVDEAQQNLDHWNAVKKELVSTNKGNTSLGKYLLSDQKAMNGESFISDSEGNINLAHIPDEVFDAIGYTKAPMRLTPSMINHVRLQHGKETKITTDEEAVDFVVDVMTNFDHVRLGDNGSLIFSVENGRNRTGKRAITILLGSDSGDYYGIKTSGYEGIERLQKRPLLWEDRAKNSSTDAASATVPSRDAQRGSEQSGSAPVQSNGSDGKGTNNSGTVQGNSGENAESDENSVPDWTRDKASDARERGFRMQNGEKVDRQGKIDGVEGSETEIDFATGETVKGTYKVVDAGSVQPSHAGRDRNILHFIPEAQPKERTDAVSDVESDRIAQDIKPDRITDSTNAYGGAPIINERGEVIQGNNRAIALKKMQNVSESKTKYKQYLMDHAEEFGLKAEDIEKMENPVLVREVKVSDDEAIRLGQFAASDLETGGIERIDAKKTLAKLDDAQIGDTMRRLFESAGEDMTIGQLIDENGVRVLKYLNSIGAITDTQYQSAFGRNGKLTEEAKNDLRKLMLHNIFEGGADNLDRMFDQLPSAAQKGLAQAMAGDMRLPKESRLHDNVQKAIEIVSELLGRSEFQTLKGSTPQAKYEYAKKLLKDYIAQADAFNEPLNKRYSELEMEIALHLMTDTQNKLKAIFKEYQRLIIGESADLFTPAEKLSRSEAIERVFNVKENGGKDNGNGREVKAGDVPESGSERGGEPPRRDGGERGADGEGSRTLTRENALDDFKNSNFDGKEKVDELSDSDKEKLKDLWIDLNKAEGTHIYRKRFQEIKDLLEGTNAEPKEPLDDDTLPFDKRIEGQERLSGEQVDALGEGFNDYTKTQIKSAIKKMEEGKPLSSLEQLFYLKALQDVRNTTRGGAEDSSDADPAQLGSGDNGTSTGADGGEGGETLPMDRPGSGEAAAGAVRTGENGEEQSGAVSGEGGDRPVSGAESADDGVSVRGVQSEGSDRTGGNGRDVRAEGGEGTGNAAAGTDSKAEIKSSLNANKKKALDALAKLAKLKKLRPEDPRNNFEAGAALASWIARQGERVDWQALGEFGEAISGVAYDYVRLGMHNFKEWAKQVGKDFADVLKDTFDWSDSEVEDYIKEMWNSAYEIDGKTHTIAEWASIIGRESLRKEIHADLNEKKEAQRAAESIEVKVGDRDNIDATLPYLLPAQRDDVMKAETQFFDKKHSDREHGNGKGMMFTNGTGTGKTYTGLGIVKRFVKQGKGRVLIVTPSQPKITDWIKDGKNLGLDITSLENMKDAGEGVVITTFANIRGNEAILAETFDLVVYDESHKIMENKKGEETVGTAVHYQLTNKNMRHATDRVKMTYEPFRKERDLRRELEDAKVEYRKVAKELEDKYDIILPKIVDSVEDIARIRRPIEEGAKAPDKVDDVTKQELELLQKAENITNRRLQIPGEIEALKPQQEALMPEIEEKAKDAVGRTKTVFLSATPFNTRESLKYAEGYIFSYPEEDEATKGTSNHRSPEEAFYEQHFSAGYRWRYGRLEQHTENPKALENQEVEFSDYLQDTLGTLSTRQIDNGYDYSRTFPTVTLDKADRFNEALQNVMRDPELRAISKMFHDTFFEYNRSTALFEAMKTSLVAERIKEHIERGRKVVVFHRRRTTKDNIENPFQQALSEAKRAAEALSMQGGHTRDQVQEILHAIAKFESEYDDLLQWEGGLDYRLPREQLASIFGADKVAFFSGEETKKQKEKSIEDFMNDNDGKPIIVIQEASGKEGISLHDMTGKHERVEMSLCLPQSPIAFIQIEGRIYRIGQKSNAIFEYPLLGLDLEMNLFAGKFNASVGTTENLAMGTRGRNIADSIARGVLEHSGTIGYDDLGIGGKEFDGNREQGMATGFDRAIQDYFTNQKMRSGRKNREGEDYFPTPEPLGFKMVEWANMTESDTVLEPSAGHGAIARYVPGENLLTVIEPSHSLMGKLMLNAKGTGRTYNDGMFEDYNVRNKHDVVVMNPPYGVGGKTAVEHVSKAFDHLSEGGRVIAIIPEGPSSDKRMDAWLNSEKGKAAVVTGEVHLPACTFGRAGTSVRTKIVVIDKITRPETRKNAPDKKNVDLRDVNDVHELFDKIRDIDMPARTVDKEYLRQKAAKSMVPKLNENRAVRFAYVLDENNMMRIEFTSRYLPDVLLRFDSIGESDFGALSAYDSVKRTYDNVNIKDGDWRFGKVYTEGRGKNKVEIREIDAVREALETTMQTIAKISGKTVDQLDRMWRERNGQAEPEEKPEMMQGEGKSDELANDTEAKQAVTEFVTETIGGTDGLNIVGHTQEEGQKVAEEHSAEMMGSTTKKRQKGVSETFEGVELNEKQQIVVGAFSGKTNNEVLNITDRKGKSRNVTFRQGDDMRAGIRHSVFKHNNTNENGYTAEEVVKVVDVLEQGTRSQDGNKVMYELKDGKVTYTVTTEIKSTGDEVFTNYYTDKKPTAGSNDTSNTAPQHASPQLVSDAKLQQNSDTTKEGTQKLTTSNGTVYGWAEGDTVHYTPEGLNPNTPIHEYTHLWAKAIQKKAPELWNNIKSLLKDNPLVKEILGEKGYEGLDEDGLYSEVLSRVSGKANAGKLEEAAQRLLDAGHSKSKVKEMLSNFKEAVKKAWSWIGKELFGIEKFDSVEEVTDRILYDLVNKTDLKLDGTEEGVELQVLDPKNPKDKETIDRLEKSEKMRGYRNVVMRPDGTFGSPMASGLRTKGQKKATTAGFELNKWEQAEENPHLANDKGKIDLVKPDGNSVAGVDYNPYIHNRPTKVNKQFKQAWERPDLVYIETEIPMDDLNSGYHAEKAAKSVGVHNWPTPSSAQKLILSRYDKPVRVVPWEEVADDWVPEFKDRGVEFDIVPPKLLPILAERGVEILPPHKGMGEKCKRAYEEWKNANSAKVKISDSSQNNSLKNSKSEDLFVSLQNKKGKDYHDTVTELAERITDGRASLLGEPEKSKRGTNTRVRAACQIIASDRGRVSSAEKGSKAYNREIETEIESWAKENNAVVSEQEVESQSFGNEIFGEGGEARAYLSKDRKTITKFLDPYKRNENSLSKCLENIGVHNAIFWDTPYKVVGVCRDITGKFRLVVEQPFVEGKQYTEDELSEYFDGPMQKVIEYFESLGFHGVDNTDGTEFSNGVYYIKDIHFGNVIFTKSGKPRIIDADVKYNLQYRKKLFGDKEFGITDNESSASDSVRFRGDGEYTARTQQQTKRVADTTQSAINALDGKGRVVTGEADMTDADRRALHKQRNATGWYDTKTGEVVVYLPNCRSEVEAQRTVMHEKVGHEGLRGLFGEEGFKSFLRKLWVKMTPEERHGVTEKMQRNGWDYLEAMDEHLAGLAEDFSEGARGFMTKVKDTVNDVLRALGWKHSSTEDDIRTALWLSKNRLAGNERNIEYKIRRKAFESKVKRMSVGEERSVDGWTWGRDSQGSKDVSRILFSRGMSDKDRNAVMNHFPPDKRLDVQTYDRRLRNWKYVWSEAFGDRLKAVDVLVETITKKSGNDIPDFYNISRKIRALGGKNTTAQDNFKREHFDPLFKLISRLQTKFDGENPNERYKALEDYAYKKHALERNRVLYISNICEQMRADGNDADADALQTSFDAERKRLENLLITGRTGGAVFTLADYYDGLDTFIRNLGGEHATYEAGKNDLSGLSDAEYAPFKVSGIATGVKGEYDDAAAIADVMNCESKMGDAGTTELWDRINAISRENVEREYKAGLIDKRVRDRMLSMFSWYLPLRGFDAKTAEDEYGYIGDNNNVATYSTHKMKGRGSAADMPISTLCAMSDYSIFRCNKNDAKKGFVALARDMHSPLLTEYETWYKVDTVGGVKTLTPYYPELKEDMTPDEIRTKIEELESTVETGRNNGERWVRLKDFKTSVPYRIVQPKDRAQHIVSCFLNGKRVDIIVNGNPRAAQAINGLVHDKEISLIDKPNRFMQQMFTSYSVTFMARNLPRDYFMATSSGLVADFAQGEHWNRDFQNIYASLALGGDSNSDKSKRVTHGMLQLFRKYRNGELKNTTNDIERYFVEFVENGGMTGFTSLRGKEEWQETINKTMSGIFGSKNSSNKAVRFVKVSQEKIFDTVKLYFNGVEKLNESVENQSRFAAYCASRMQHRSVSRSVSDAKEITLNFNRSGAGWGTHSLNTANASKMFKFNRDMAAMSASYLRHANWFFNPAIQGMSKMYDLATGGNAAQKARFMGTFVGLPILGCLAAGAVGQLVANLVDSDDDHMRYGDNPYDQLPEYVRRNNICMYMGHGNFITIPIAIEQRPAYAIADVCSRAARGVPSDSEYDSPVLDILAQMTQLTPVDLGGGSKVGYDDARGSLIGFVTPSILMPIGSVTSNVAWTGARVHNRTDKNTSEAEWQRGLRTTSGAYINFAKELSIATGGDEKGVRGGAIDINPAILEYLADSYIGGPGKEAKEVIRVLSEDKDLSRLPIVKALLRSGRTENALSSTRNRWYEYSKKFNSETKPWLKGFKKEGEVSEYNLLKDSKDGKIGRVVMTFEPRMKALTKARNEAKTKEEKDYYSKLADETMMQAMEIIDRIEKK